jgi:ABC-type branched-subunit amino acid transport system ATPase component
VRANERAAATFGLSPTATKLSGFALAGFLAAAAGVLWLAAFRTVSPELFPAQQSFLMLSIAVVGGISSVAGAALGAVFIFGIPALTSDWVKSVFSNSLQFQLFLGGLGLILVQIGYPGGIAATMARAWDRFILRLERDLRNRPQPVIDEDIAVRVEGVTVTFGPKTALDDVTLEVRRGEIVGLIGSNGAGKTTLMNVVSGLIEPDHGSVVVDGRELLGLAPEFRPFFGVARTFQDARLFPGLTVRETLQIAVQRRHRVGFLASLLRAPWVRYTERHTGDAADEVLAALGLTEYADVPTERLPTGVRRVCDLAAQVASRPKVLLLDEPTAGIAQRDAEAFGPLVRRLAAELGCSVIVIEHDMPLMFGLADRVYCLEAGRVIVEGTPTEVSRDPNVIASYLGTNEIAISRSGATSVGSTVKPARRRRPRVAVADASTSTKTTRATRPPAKKAVSAKASTNGARGKGVGKQA